MRREQRRRQLRRLMSMVDTWARARSDSFMSCFSEEGLAAEAKLGIVDAHTDHSARVAVIVDGESILGVAKLDIADSDAGHIAGVVVIEVGASILGEA